MQEKWKDIKGYEGLYQVSNFGSIKSLKRKRYNYKLQKTIEVNTERFLKPFADKKGYLRVKLQNNTNKKTVSIHRLVAQAFLDNPNHYPQINHIDGVKTNNLVNNLEWCTCSYNVKEAFNIGLSKKGKNHYRSKPIIQYDLDNNFIRQWDSIIDAINELKLNKYASSGISLCCQGKIKTAYGYKWKYVIY